MTGVKRSVEQLLWAIALALLAALGIPLFVLSLVSALLIVIWIGLPLTCASVAVIRPYAGVHRRFAGWYLHRAVLPPYLPFRKGGVFQRIRDVAEDPATWRDLAWLFLNATLGLGLAIVCLVEAVFGLLLFWVPRPTLLGVDALLIRRMLGADESQVLERRVKELTASRAETVDTQSQELRRIERDLHDGAQARLVALSMSLGLAEDLLDRDPEAARQLVTEARTATSDALVELRDLVRGIHPPVLADRGLVGALQALVVAAPLPVTLTSDVPRLPAPVESAAYFAVCEVLTNAIKHSGASAVDIILGFADELLVMSVQDNGRGGALLGAGTGLRGIERRLSSFDGTLVLTSPVGGPTLVRMEVPCASYSPKTSPSSATG